MRLSVGKRRGGGQSGGGAQARSSRSRQHWWSRPHDAKVLSQNPCHDPLPAGGDVQLLRTCQQILQPTDQGDDPRLQIGRIGVEQAHRQALLPGMVALFGDSAEQPRATGDRLVMLPRRDQPIIQRPPVIDQGEQPRGLDWWPIAGW